MSVTISLVVKLDIQFQPAMYAARLLTNCFTQLLSGQGVIESTSVWIIK